MAQNGQIALSICRSCRRQLKISAKHSRAFTSTPRPQKTLPTFTPTANEELDNIFLSFRKKYFTPYALAKHHRALMYKPSKSQILLNDPGVTVTLSDGEEVKLMPTDPSDKPPKRPTLRRIKELLATSDDSKRWNNLPAFLEGMQLAKETLSDGWLEQMVRKANEVGKAGVIIRCAEMVKKTGVCLADPLITRELMLGVHNRAAEAGWEGEELENAAKQAEQIALMLEDEYHCGGKLMNGYTDMRRDLGVLGTLLEMAAAKAFKIEKGKDVEGKVSSYVAKLLALWTDKSLKATDIPERKLETWLPLLHGMKIALKVDGISPGDNGPWLRVRQRELESAVMELRQQVIGAAGGKPRRCLQMYDSLEVV